MVSTLLEITMETVAPHVSECASCGAPITRGVCAACALGDLLPEALAETTQAAELNANFGRYLLKKKLATGGMGVVYLAADQKLKRTVALKMIKGSTFANEAEIARFTLEAEAAAMLDHPNIMPVYEVGVIDEQPFFTMKLISGSSLSARLRADEQPDLRSCVQWLKAIAEAVQHAHERGVLHRDLKPGNVLIDESGKPWLTDFGLAKMVHQESGLTLSSDRLGTPHYMAPEVLRHTAHAASIASDVWALGVMLWESLTGELPFQGKDPLEVMRQIGEQEPTSDRTVDRDLLTLAHRCLEKDPKRRVASAGLLAEELGRWLRSEPLQVRPVTTGERLWKWGKRNPAWAALGVVFVLGSLSSLLSWQRAERAVDSLTDGNRRLTQSLETASATQLAMHARFEVEENASRALLLAAESVEMSKRATGKVLPATAEALYQAMQVIGGTDLSVPLSRAVDADMGFISRFPSREYPLCFSADRGKVLILDHTSESDVMAAGFDLQTTPPRRLFRFPHLAATRSASFPSCRLANKALAALGC